MGSVWLSSLPDVLRNAGLNVATYPGWETRSRGSGGYDSILGIQCHHTASSGTNPANEMAYMWRNASTKPIGAIYLAPDGKVTVGAAGVTNTSGKGGPMLTSRGMVPLNSGNRFLISIEAANRGDGTPWPRAQQDAYVKMCAALTKAYLGGILLVPGDCGAHFEWTSRKVDPAGSSRYAQGANKWNMTLFRSDVTGLIAAPTPLPPPKPPGVIVTTTKSVWQQARVADVTFGPGDRLVRIPQAVGYKAATINLHVVTPNHDGFITAFLGPQPDVSTVNYSTGIMSDATATVPVDAEGWFALNSTGYVRVLVDLVGVHS